MNYRAPKEILKMASFGNAAQAVATTTEYPASTGLLSPSGARFALAIISGLNASSDGCTIDYKLRHCSETNGTYVDITGATSATQVPSTNSLSSIRVIQTSLEYIDSYIRLSATTGAGTNGPTISGVIIYFGFSQFPQAATLDVG